MTQCYSKHLVHIGNFNNCIVSVQFIIKNTDEYDVKGWSSLNGKLPSKTYITCTMACTNVLNNELGSCFDHDN